MTNDKSAPQGSQPGNARPGQARPPHRILVVDDEPSDRQLIINSLASEGYRVDAAVDGARAWEALQVRHYDLLITDHNMPEITGIALVRKLRGKGSTLPVVMATGTVPEEELERHPGLGISDILIKPFTIEQILKTVRRVLCDAGRAGAASINSQLSTQHTYEQRQLPLTG